MVYLFLRGWARGVTSGVGNEGVEEGPCDLEADAAGGAGDDYGDAVERGQLERVGQVAGGDPLEEELPHDAHPPAAPLQPPQRLLPPPPRRLLAAGRRARLGRRLRSSVPLLPAGVSPPGETVAQVAGHLGAGNLPSWRRGEERKAAVPPLDDAGDGDLNLYSSGLDRVHKLVLQTAVPCVSFSGRFLCFNF